MGENQLNEQSYKPDITFEPNQFVAVHDEGIWKRGLIEVVNSQNYQVQLIDYGKSDIIPEKRVHTIPDSVKALLFCLRILIINIRKKIPTFLKVIQFPILAFRLQLRYMQPLNELSTNESLRKKIVNLLLSQPVELKVVEREAGQLHHVKIYSEIVDTQISKFIAECKGMGFTFSYFLTKYLILCLIYFLKPPKAELNDSGRGSISSDVKTEFVYQLQTKYEISIESAVDSSHIYLSVIDQNNEYESLQVILSKLMNT